MVDMHKLSSADSMESASPFDSCPTYVAYQDYADLQAENKRLREVLEHIQEYWNKDRNDTAMCDALWHIINECELALTPSPSTKG